MSTEFQWRGPFDSVELNHLHATAFGTRLYDESEWNWVDLVHRHSLGWVVARDAGRLLGFTNVVWDGLLHAWIQDVTVADDARHEGVGSGLVAAAGDGARAAGCGWLHVDFEVHLRPFYFEACGFTPTNAGVLSLNDEDGSGAEGGEHPGP